MVRSSFCFPGLLNLRRSNSEAALAPVVDEPWEALDEVDVDAFDRRGSGFVDLQQV